MTTSRLVVLALVAAAAPLAAAQAPQAPNNGAMTFPNVRVVHVPTQPRVAPPTEALTAYLDPESGVLTAPSFDQIEELMKAPGHRKPDPKRRPSVRTLPGGGLVLDAPSSMINLSIARRHAGGVEMACTASDALSHAVLAGEGQR
jgi:hypothetical protein